MLGKGGIKTQKYTVELQHLTLNCGSYLAHFPPKDGQKFTLAEMDLLILSGCHNLQYSVAFLCKYNPSSGYMVM